MICMRTGWCAAAILLMACHHAGSGVGELRAPGDKGMQQKGRVTLEWQSGADTSTGDIEAKLPDGRLFKGTFVQPQTTEWRSNYDVYWGIWTGPWGRAGPWYTGPRSNFNTHYSSQALAHLETPDGTRMRCAFALFAPDRGLSGGGQGDCQLSTNEEVFDAVLQIHTSGHD
jgi:hypothetical protein